MRQGHAHPYRGILALPALHLSLISVPIALLPNTDRGEKGLFYLTAYSERQRLKKGTRSRNWEGTLFTNSFSKAIRFSYIAQTHLPTHGMVLETLDEGPSTSIIISQCNNLSQTVWYGQSLKWDSLIWLLFLPLTIKSQRFIFPLWIWLVINAVNTTKTTRGYYKQMDIYVQYV